MSGQTGNKSDEQESLIFKELSTEILKKNHILRFEARGGSMHPFIKDCDIIKIKSVSPEKLNPGDIVFFSSDNEKLIAHRIIKIQKGKSGSLSFLTKGDACDNYDKAISSSKILGKIISIERNGKEISSDSRKTKFKNYMLSKLSPYSVILYPIGKKAKRIGMAILKK